MTLEEIMEASSNAAEMRVQRLTLNAKAAKEKANQMTKQANLSADILKQRESRQKLAKARKASCGKMIKPYK